jgi:histidyl-tRNA synthetase
MSGMVEAVRGMRDILPDEHDALNRVRQRLHGLMASYGYAMLDVPVVEYRDLYQRKLGEELVGKVYEFQMGGRDLALRPELTASVLRAYVTHLQEQPLPLRLCYSGPVFRYERPQRVTYRQFTQTGVELVGGPTPRGDAEVVALACAGLEAVGISGYHVQIGHIGLIRQILTRLGLTERTQGMLIWSLERMRARGVDEMRERLRELRGDKLPIDPALLAHLDDTQAQELLLHLLDEMKINISFGTRAPEAIANRLVRKLRRDDPEPYIERALEILGRLSQIHGPPTEVLPQVTALLEDHRLPTTALDELRAVLALLEAHGLPAERVVVDFGLGRGLNYYTGLIFELYDAEEYQLCGGGRYDDLVATLGGRSGVPAVGFAYGLERVAAAAALPAREPARSVLVVAVAEDDYAYALEVAQQLRGCGFVVTVDVRERNVAKNLSDAARRNVTHVAIVGANERAERTLVWRELASREEQHIALDALDTLTGR